MQLMNMDNNTRRPFQKQYLAIKPFGIRRKEIEDRWIIDVKDYGKAT